MGVNKLRRIYIIVNKDVLKLKKIFIKLIFNGASLFFNKSRKIGNGKKKKKGSHTKIRKGKVKNIYTNEVFFEYLVFKRIKNIINPTNKKTSFLAKTSNSANGYKRNKGENKAVTVNIFFGTSLIKM